MPARGAVSLQTRMRRKTNNERKKRDLTFELPLGLSPITSILCSRHCQTANAFVETVQYTTLLQQDVYGFLLFSMCYISEKDPLFSPGE